MTLDPETTARIVEATAEKLRQDILAHFGNLADLVVIDLSTAAQCVGLTRRQAGRVLPTVKVSARLTGVRLSALQAHLSR